jgi:hypothetical protein
MLGLCRIASAARLPSPPPGYRVFHTISLAVETDGMNGNLQLLQDERITDDLRESMGGADEAMYCYDDSLGGFCKSIRARPLQPAVVRLVDGAGRVVEARTFTRELATMDVRELYGRRPRAFSVTVDLGIGWGSYAGDTTFFFDLKGGRFRWLKARPQQGGAQVDVVTMKSLKTSWQLVRIEGRASLDILEIRCRPKSSEGSASTEVEFELIYRRFHFRGNGWILSERRAPGFWEDEGEFPGAEQFPQ